MIHKRKAHNGIKRNRKKTPHSLQDRCDVQRITQSCKQSAVGEHRDVAKNGAIGTSHAMCKCRGASPCGG